MPPALLPCGPPPPEGRGRLCSTDLSWLEEQVGSSVAPHQSQGLTCPATSGLTMAAMAEPAFSSPGTSAAEWPSRPSGITATCLSSCVPLPHPVHRRTPLAVVSCGAICHECHSSISSGCRTWSKLLWMPRSWLSIRGDPGLAVPKVGTHLAHLCVLRAEHRAWCPGVTKLVIVE